MPIINGTANADTLVGSAGDDTINGLAGDDRLNGLGGIDHLYGGLGNDVFVVDNLSDRPKETVGQGSDTVFTSTSYWLVDQESIERLGTTSIAGTDAIRLTGNSFDQTITGNAGDNAINGGGGVDTLVGYAGNDSYIVDNANADVVEAVADHGSDTVFTSVSYRLGAGQSVDYLATALMFNSTVINLTGNELAQTIRGDYGSNILDGGGGGDTLIGGNGDDTYIVRSVGDHVVEAAGQGVDTVNAFSSFTLGFSQSVEVIQAAHSASTTGLHFTGNTLDQLMIGGAGNDTLSGGGGADTLRGGLGNDIYVVTSTNAQIFEAAGQGGDAVFATVSYALTEGQSVERLATAAVAGTNAIDLTGTSQAETIIGNNGANHLNGVSGSDTLFGYGGDDTLMVSATSGTANGGTGTDVLQVIGSNISNFNDISHLSLISVEVLDTNGGLVELTSSQAKSFNSIIDTFSNTGTYIDITDSANIDFSEKVTSGTGISIFLQAAGNVITASDYADTIFAQSGGDTINCGNGNDLIHLDLGHSIVGGGDGDDFIYTSYPEDNGTFVLSGGQGNDFLSAGMGADSLAGGDGSDRLTSKGGHDTIEGGGSGDTIDATPLTASVGGEERYVFAQVSDSTSIAHDLIINADLDHDVFSFPTTPTSIAAAVTSGTLSTASFDSDLAAAVDPSQLGAHEALLFDPDSGDLNQGGHVFLVIDANGVAGYQAAQDYVIELQDATGTLTLADFV